MHAQFEKSVLCIHKNIINSTSQSESIHNEKNPQKSKEKLHPFSCHQITYKAVRFEGHQNIFDHFTLSKEYEVPFFHQREE